MSAVDSTPRRTGLKATLARGRKPERARAMREACARGDWDDLSEARLMGHIAAYIEYAYGHAWMGTTTHGVKQSVTTGYRAGWPDMVIYHPRPDIGLWVFFIEFKRRGGLLSEDQFFFMAEVNRGGGGQIAEIVYGPSEAMRLVDDIFGGDADSWLTRRAVCTARDALIEAVCPVPVR